MEKHSLELLMMNSHHVNVYRASANKPAFVLFHMQMGYLRYFSVFIQCMFFLPFIFRKDDIEYDCFEYDGLLIQNNIKQ